jgi:hypothetical protein
LSLLTENISLTVLDNMQFNEVKQITVARSNSQIVGSNPTGGMDVCVCLFCVYAVLCVGSGLARG